MIDFSFIIPVYNVNSYLADFYAAFKKNKNFNCEIIFVNDGSTDESVTTIENFQKIDPRIILLNKENGGVSSARNAGILIAKGKFIGCLDPDDILHPRFLSALGESLKYNESLDTIIYDYKKISDFDKCEDKNEKINLSMINKEELFKIHNYPWLRVVKREFFDNNLFPDGIIYEDSVVVPILNERAVNIVYINCELYFYRVRNSSLTNSSLLRNLDLIKALDILRERIELLNIPVSIFYATCAHLSRSSLVIWAKAVKIEKNGTASAVIYKSVTDAFCKINTLSVIGSNASIIDKLAFLLIKMRRFGFSIFILLYSRLK